MLLWCWFTASNIATLVGPNLVRRDACDAATLLQETAQVNLLTETLISHHPQIFARSVRFKPDPIAAEMHSDHASLIEINENNEREHNLSVCDTEIERKAGGTGRKSSEKRKTREIKQKEIREEGRKKEEKEDQEKEERDRKKKEKKEKKERETRERKHKEEGEGEEDDKERIQFFTSERLVNTRKKAVTLPQAPVILISQPLSRCPSDESISIRTEPHVPEVSEVAGNGEQEEQCNESNSLKAGEQTKEQLAETNIEKQQDDGPLEEQNGEEEKITISLVPTTGKDEQEAGDIEQETIDSEEKENKLDVETEAHVSNNERQPEQKEQVQSMVEEQSTLKDDLILEAPNQAQEPNIEGVVHEHLERSGEEHINKTDAVDALGSRQQKEDVDKDMHKKDWDSLWHEFNLEREKEAEKMLTKQQKEVEDIKRIKKVQWIKEQKEREIQEIQKRAKRNQEIRKSLKVEVKEDIIEREAEGNYCEMNSISQHRRLFEQKITEIKGKTREQIEAEVRLEATRKKLEHVVDEKATKKPEFIQKLAIFENTSATSTT